MANTIRIKRSASTNEPTSLLQGELANSEVGSPSGINELWIGTTGPTVFKLIRNLNGSPAEPTAGLAAATPVTADYMVFEDVTDSQGKRVLFSATPLSIFNNDSGWEANQTITTGLAIDGADAGSTGNITLDFAPVELTNVAPVAADQFVFNDATDDTPKKQVASSIALSIFNDDLVKVDSLTAGVGIINNGTAADPDIALDFSELTDMTGAISGTTELILQDGTTESRKAASEIELRHFDNDLFGTTATFAFDSTTTAGDPGPGELRYDNATPASVTNLYIDDLEENGNDFAWILSNLAVNDIIVIKSIDDPADYMICQVDAATTDNTGYWTVPVNPLFTGTVPTAADRLSFEVQWFSQGTAGTVTSVTAGTGLVNSGTASAVVLDFDFSELTDMTGAIAGTTEFILQDGTTESRKAASEIDLGTMNNNLGWEANQTITTGTGIDGADAGSSGNITLSLALDELGVTTPTGADWLAFDDAGTSSKALISSFDVGLFNNATAEYVSENDTIVVADWNWVLDEDTLSSDSDVHVPTQQSVKAYVDAAVTGGLVYKGGFDPTASAGAGSPDLDSITSTTGDTYTVTVAGTYNWTTGSAVLEVGDVLIAEADGVLNNVNQWTIVQNNIGQASESAAGYAELATQTETDNATDDLRIVTPLKLHNTTFDGGTF
jgi:hypothetical protein